MSRGSAAAATHVATPPGAVPGVRRSIRMETAVALRPLRHLRQVAQEYPGLWPQIDQMRTQRGRHLPLWPPYCFLPLAGAVAIVTGGARAPQPAPLLGP